jgi:transposase
MTPTGSEPLLPKGAFGPTSHQNAIEVIQSASAPISTVARNLIERFFNKIKQCRRIATRYDTAGREIRN